MTLLSKLYDQTLHKWRQTELLKSLETQQFVFIIYACVLLVYIPLVVIQYGFADDYTNIYINNGHDAGYNIFKLISGGRPIYAILNYWAFQRIHTVNDFWWLRCISISGIAFAAALIYSFARHKGFSVASASTIALLIPFTPPFQVFASFAVAASYPWAATLAGLAFWLADENRPSSASRIAVSFLLLLVSITIYQPAAMMFWVMAGISWLSQPSPPSLSRLHAAEQ